MLVKILPDPRQPVPAYWEKHVVELKAYTFSNREIIHEIGGKTDNGKLNCML